MKKLVCEICGSQNLKKVSNEYVCQECGATYSLEDAKNLLVEVEEKGNGSSNTNSELDNLYELARRARKEDNCTNALKYYSTILEKNPYDWEAAFYQVYFQGRLCKLGEIGVYADRLASSVLTTVSLIKDNVEGSDNQFACIKEMANSAMELSNHFYYNALNFYNGISYSIRGNYTQELINNVIASSSICLNLGVSVESNFMDKLAEDSIERKALGNICKDLFITFVVQRNGILKKLSLDSKKTQTDQILMVEEKIKKYNPNYVSIMAEKEKTLLDPKSYATMGIVFAFIVPLVGIIIGWDGYKKCKVHDNYKAYKNWFIAAQIIPFVLILLIIILSVAFM